MVQDNDTIDLADLGRILRRGLRWIVGGALVGLLTALILTLVLPRQYEATSTVLLRDQPDTAVPELGRLGGLGGLLPSASGFETELEVLTSRSVMGAVVDSLLLQVRVRIPAGMPARALFARAEFAPEVDGERYRFRRDGGEFRVRGPGVDARIAPGAGLRVGGSALVLRDAGLPDEFTVEILDRNDVITQADRRLRARRSGGDVASLVYRDADPLTAAAVPNLLVDLYLQTRTSSDRGVNQRRYEFLRTQIDSMSVELTRAEEALRSYQELSGAVDPVLRGEAEFERAMTLRAQLETSNVEARTLRQLLERIRSGTLATQDLAAYPTFIANSAVNDLLGRLLDIEVKRTELLHLRTPTDPDVLNLEETREALETRLVAISEAYLRGLQQQQQEVQRELATYRAALDALPADGQQSLRLQRQVRRLSETLLELESQLVGARLAALGEGGDVRRIDAAEPPRRHAFPRLFMNLLAGLVGGLVIGAGAALGRGYLGSALHTAYDVERASGMPATTFDARAPLLLAPQGQRGSLLLVPLGGAADVAPVAYSLAETASLRGARVVLALMDGGAEAPRLPGTPGGRGLAAGAPMADGATAGEVSPAGFAVHRWTTGTTAGGGPQQFLEELERQHTLVVTVVPGLDRFPTPALLSPPRSVVFVAPAGKLTRSELDQASRMLGRLGLDVMGVVLQNGSKRGGAS